MIKQAKVNYFNKIISEESDPRKLWNTIINAFGIKMPKFTQIKELLDPETNTELRDPIQIASCFNKHFIQIRPQLANVIPTEPHIVINQSASFKAFHIQPVD